MLWGAIPRHTSNFFPIILTLKMKKQYIIFTILVFLCSSAIAQSIHVPSIAPAFFSHETEITVTYDVTGSPLANLPNAWIWVWIPRTGASALDSRYNINPASSNPTATDNAKFTKRTEDGRTTFSITFTPKDFFTQDISEHPRIGMLLKGNDWANGQTNDFITEFFVGGFSASLLRPLLNPLFVETNAQIEIEAEASENSVFTLFVNDQQVDQQSDIENYQFVHTVTETEGLVPVRLTVEGPEEDQTEEFTFNYILRTPVAETPRPAGIIEGINYHTETDKVTLCLLAPLKHSVYVLGEFNNFQVKPEYLMHKDGEYFWLQINGLQAGQEYAFQYLVDETIRVADPYADKILDPDDRFIPESIYPNLKSFPEVALSSEWFNNRLAIIQTGQQDFNWQVTNFQRPPQEDLMIYELLIRDFFAENDRNYDRLIDTLSYLKRLGVNAIELMPIMEFNGNESWGYNTTFMFAPDKAYGPKNRLKAFIDAAHAEGMAVILDIVLNHHDIPNPYVLMYFDGNNPTAENPWFNTTPKHPFNVFFDMDHESLYSQHYVDTTLYYWLNEYKVDGFRFDLSKGFTQFNSAGNVGLWSQLDQSRVALLKRMNDKVRTYDETAYMMLEHFADNAEETILANENMMLWGNLHGNYKEALLGFPANNNASFNWAYYKSRNWSKNNLITYMESHDESRQMWEMVNFGNSEGSTYNVRDTLTALERKKMGAAFLFTIPGAKMWWQFGELGYDYDINFNGRTGNKPVRWDYYEDPDRQKLFRVFGEIIRFRNDHAEVFNNASFNWKPGGAFRYITLSDTDLEIHVVGNFDMRHRDEVPFFPKTGTWYDFFTGMEHQVNSLSETMTLRAGQFHIFTDKKIEGVETGLVPWRPDMVTGFENIANVYRMFPNPANHMLELHLADVQSEATFRLIDVSGRAMDAVIKQQSREDGRYILDISRLQPGIYHLETRQSGVVKVNKFIKN